VSTICGLVSIEVRSIDTDKTELRVSSSEKD